MGLRVPITYISSKSLVLHPDCTSQPAGDRACRSGCKLAILNDHNSCHVSGLLCDASRNRCAEPASALGFDSDAGAVPLLPSSACGLPRCCRSRRLQPFVQGGSGSRRC